MKCLITGAGGFIGGQITRRLLEEGHQVVTYQRGKYPDLLQLEGTHLQGSIDQLGPLSDAMKGVDTVFHVAALAAISGPTDDFHNANVEGTRNIIQACRQNKVPRLVFTSSPSVVFSGRDQNGIDESEPYPDSYLADYPRTKAIAESEVLDANSSELATISIRPHLVWGPGDRHLYPRIVERAKNGKLKLVHRNGMKIDACYIDNAVDAHLCAMESLRTNPNCRGKAYFISNEEPTPPEELINQFLECAGISPIRPSIPPSLAYAAGWIIEALYRTPFFTGEPPVTRFVVHQQATSHWFDLTAAKRDLGWNPKISTAEGLKRLKDYHSGQSSIAESISS